MVTVTWSPSGKQIFVNAVSDGTSATAQTLNAGGSTYTVGKRNNGTEQFDGDIDEMAVWSRVLSPSEITALYNSGTGMGYAGTSPSYTYAGTGYANPHAVTTRFDGTATTTYAYDANGNLTSAILGATTTTYIWDYQNHLTATRTTGDSATTTYGYDYSGQRVISQTASSTTVFPSKYFSITSTQVGSSTLATSTSYIFASDQLVAYVEQPLIDGAATGTAATYYVHPDHLGSTNVVSDENGDVSSVRDYFPFGSTRVQTGPQSLGRGYIGEFQDSDDFSYLNNRYYRSSQGQFISEDPVHLAIGNPQQVQALTGKSQQAYLADPQLLNSYSYARNNPIVTKDPQGTCPICILGLGLSGGYLYGLANQYEYDQGRGQMSNVSNYVDSGVKGIFQGGATAGSLMALGPATALEYYGYYQTYQGLRDFNEQILSNNSVNYTEQQQRLTAGQTWLDIVQRIASAFTPQPLKTGYDATNSILNSLIQISSQYNKGAASATQYVVQGNSTYARTSGGGLAPTSLPATVSQGGSTYYRNSSGLLSTTPGL